MSKADSGLAVRRFKRAIAASSIALFALVLACAVPAFGSTAFRGASSSSPSLVSAAWEAIRSGRDVIETLKGDGILKLTEENAPDWLEKELIGLRDMDQAVANESMQLIWFLKKGNLEDVLASIEETLSSKGWSSCGQPGKGIETFIKREGICTWVMVECAQAGDEVAIVLHIGHT